MGVLLESERCLKSLDHLAAEPVESLTAALLGSAPGRARMLDDALATLPADSPLQARIHEQLRAAGPNLVSVFLTGVNAERHVYSERVKDLSEIAASGGNERVREMKDLQESYKRRLTLLRPLTARDLQAQ